MRIRSIKPEFWRSPDITNLAIEDRLLFIGLWSYVDDNGVGRDDVAAIVADLFATDMFRDPRETVARVSRGLSNLFTAGRIARYVVDERPYLSITNWEKHQRIDKPARPRYPSSDGENAILATPSRDRRDTLAPGTGEQGNRGTEEQGNRYPAPSVLADGFEAAWKHWPKKVERKNALERFAAAVRKIDITELVNTIIRFGDAYAATTEKKFVPALGVWLHGERWTDEMPSSSSNQPRPSKDDQALEVLAMGARLQQQEIEK